MIVLATVTIAALVVFGVGASRLALQDLALLEAQDAVQRAAEGSAAHAAELIVAGAPDGDVDMAARSEASALAAANVARGTVGSVSVARSSSTSDLVDVTVTLVASYGGYPGPLTVTTTGRAAVPRP